MAQKPNSPKSGGGSVRKTPAAKPEVKRAPARDDGRLGLIVGKPNEPVKSPGTGGTGLKAKTKGDGS